MMNVLKEHKVVQMKLKKKKDQSKAHPIMSINKPSGTMFSIEDPVDSTVMAGMNTDVSTQLNNDESIELQSFPRKDEKVFPNIPDENKNETGASRAREEWVMLEETNFLGRLKIFFHRFWHGPEVPVDETPTFPSHWVFMNTINEFPGKYFENRFSAGMKTSLVVLYCSMWFGIISSLIYPYLFHKPMFISRDGTKTREVVSLSCNAQLNWKGKNNACGLNAENCTPFEDQDYYIRCPALCDRGGWVYSPLAVGDERIRYKTYVIGGGRISDKEAEEELDAQSYPYRADSYPCAAGVHAGLVSPAHGACLKVSMSGAQLAFDSKNGKTGNSISFSTFFPSSFVLREKYDAIASGCYDPRVLVVVLNIIFGLPLFYISNSLIGYWVTTMVGYWSIVLVFDPPVIANPNDMNTIYDLFSVGFQRLLPLCFVLYVMWACSIKRCLENGSPLLKIMFWYPLFWLGTLNNVTFDRLPVDRLTPEDLKDQPAALASVLFIISIIAVSACFQGYSIWKSGRFQKYFKIYITMIITLFLFAYLPHLSLRIHHYILGMMLTPGCATRGVSAYVLQGILIGLILSGVGRWDFASILETRRALLRGGAGDAAKPPQFHFDSSSNFAISWEDISPDESNEYDLSSFTGYSLLANDIEVYTGTNQTVYIDELLKENDFLQDLVDGALDYQDDVKLYLRVAHANVYDSSKRGDYTNAAVYYYPSGNWTDPKVGVS